MNAYRPFVRRIRALRAVRGALTGLAVGGGIAVLGSSFGATGALVVPAGALLLMAGVAVIIGALTGLMWPVRFDAVVRSIDRRAGLQDRLSSSRELPGDGAFESALREDAARALAGVRPAGTYPLRLGRMWALTALPALLAAAIYLVGNTPILLSPQERATRRAQERQAEEIRRVVMPLAQEVRDQGAADERRLVEALEELQKDLARGRAPREEALQRANAISEDAQELSKRRAEQALATVAEAEDAMTRLALDQLARQTSRMTPDQVRALHGMSRDERDALRAMGPSEAKSESHALSGQIEEVRRQSRDAKEQAAQTERQLEGLDPDGAQAKALKNLLKRQRDRLKGLEKELERLREALSKIQLSEDVREMMRKLSEHPEMSKLRDMAAKIAQEAERAKKGQQPKLTPEDIQEMIDQLDEMADELERLARELKDPEAMRQYLESMRKALEKQGQCNKIGLVGSLLPGLCGLPGLPAPGGAEDVMFHDTESVNHNASGKPSEGETRPEQVLGERREEGLEDYVEVRGPASLGERAKTPYSRVPSSYRRRAEQAIERNQIPKQHEKRVREYFESLGGKR